MAQFYARPRVQRLRDPLDTEPGSSSVPEVTIDRDSIDSVNDHSIYVFPNPSSNPPSPSSSSALSLPTDFSVSRLSSFDAEDSDLDSRRGTAARARSISTSRSALSGWEEVLISEVEVVGNSRYVRHSGIGSDSEPQVEIWGWPLELETEDESGEDDFGRARTSGRDPHPHPLGNSSSPRPSSYSSRPPPRPAQYVSRPIRRVPRLSDLHLKSRSSLHSLSSSPTSLLATPAPRMHIPLLSFFVSLLSIDDGTLHLLTYPSASESALFPGCPVPVPLPADSKVGDPEGVLEPLADSESLPRRSTNSVHGLLKLLLPPEELRSLKEGIRFACDSSRLPANLFRLPGIVLPLDILSNADKIWRRVWRDSHPSPGQSGPI